MDQTTAIDPSQFPVVMQASRTAKIVGILAYIFFIVALIFPFSQSHISMTTLTASIARSPWVFLVLVLMLAGLIIFVLYILLENLSIQITLERHSIILTSFFKRRSCPYDEIAKAIVSSGRGTKWLSIVPARQDMKRITIPLHVLSAANRQILGKLFKDKIVLSL